MSMKRFISIDGVETTIAEAATNLVNKQIRELLNRCLQAKKIEHLFDIAIIGYGKDAYSAWVDDLGGRFFMSPEEITKLGHLANQSGATQGAQRWITSRCDGESSDYSAALTKAESLVNEWIEGRGEKDYYPPSIIHITDGLSLNKTHSDYVYLSRLYYSLIAKAKQDNFLIFNVILAPECDDAIFCPRDKGELYDRYELLFDLSSYLPERYNNEIAKIRGDFNSDFPYKAMALNCDISLYMNLLGIGTDNN